MTARTPTTLALFRTLLAGIDGAQRELETERLQGGSWHAAPNRAWRVLEETKRAWEAATGTYFDGTSIVPCEASESATENRPLRLVKGEQSR